MKAYLVAAMLALLTPSAAAAQGGEEFYSGPGGWRVMVQGGGCTLVSAQSEGAPRFVVSGFREGEAFVDITLAQTLGAHQAVGPFTMRMGHATETVGFASQRNQLFLSGFPPYLSDAFRRSEVIELMAGGQVIAEIPLTGSAAAYRQFEACRTSLPPGRPQITDYSPPPPPRPLVPGPDLSGPLPANRRATPIMIQNWLTSYDVPVLEHPAAGRVRYAVIVGVDGRVRDCSIASSSGSSPLDEATCRVISRRARFDPATDANGTPIEGSFSGSVDWQVPVD